MAEVNVVNLPTISLEEFTDNDRFLIVDDGKLRQLTKSVFQLWLTENVQGERGLQGLAGRDGVDGAKGANGTNGADGLSAYQVAVNTGFVGTIEQWKASLKGATGAAGANGNNGYSPVIRTVSRDTDLVLQVYDWAGGTGTKPATGYIGSTGIVTNIANAANIRGTKGDQGIQGVDGVQGLAGEDGIDGKTVESILFNSDLSVTVTYTDATTVTSNTPPKVTGWGTYKDSQYTSASAFNIPINAQEVIPNNATIKIENLPVGITAFYDPVTQKYFLSDVDGYYSVRVRFKVAPSTTAGAINLSMNKATTDVPYSEDKELRGDNKIQDMNFSTFIYGDTALAANGMTIRLKTFDRDISIYNIEVIVAKLI